MFPKRPTVCETRDGKCECEICRFSAADMKSAPEVDPHAKPARAAKAMPEEIVLPPGSRMHEDPDREPSVYDSAHNRTLLVPPTAQTAIYARRVLLLIVARTREVLPLCEHEWGVTAIKSVLEILEADAEKCGAIASGIIQESAQRAGAMP